MMWYCNKCGEWYENSITILKHFQVMHSPSKIQKKVMDLSKPRAEEILPSPKKKINSEMREKIFPLLCKKKTEDDKPKNGMKRSAVDGVIRPIKKKCSEGTASHLQNVNMPLSQNALAPKKIQMHVTNMKDPKFVDKLMSKKLGAEDLFDQIKTYICKFCCRRFTNPNTLKLHLLTHKGNPVHMCHLCGFTVCTFSALMAHYVKHSGIKTFGASDFPAKNESATTLSKPASPKKSPDKSKTGILCTKCNRTFNSKSQFSTHYCPPLNKKTEYVCTYCRKVTFTVEEYRDHIQSHSTAHLICGHCSVKFETKSSLQAHFKSCKKRANSLGLPKKVCLLPKEVSPLAGFRFRKIKPKVEDASTDSSSKDNQTSSLGTAPKNESVVVKQEPKSPVPEPANERNDDEDNTDLPSASGDEAGSRRNRSQRLKSSRVSTAPVQSVADSLPTRRSARLVNRKPVKFSQGSSDSEIEDISIYEEVRSPRRQRSPTKPVEVPVPPVTSPVPKKVKLPSTKSPKKESVQQSTSPKSPKAAKVEVAAQQDSKSLQLNEEIERDLAKVHGIQPEEVEELIVDECVKDSTSSKQTGITGSPKKESKLLQSPKTTKNVKGTVKLKKKKNCGKPGPKAAEADEEEGNNKQMTLVCNLCSLIFRSKGSLKRHRKMHSGKPQFSCQYCGKFFFRKDIHRRHEGNVHLTDEDKKLLCYYCKETFTDSAKLKEHSYAIHASRAMAPERIRRCTFTKSAASQKVAVKVEPDAAQDESSTSEQQESSRNPESKEKEDKKDTIFNCGTCNIMFSSPSDLVKHFNEVHITPENVNIVHLKKENSGSSKPQNSSPIKETKKVATKKVPEPKTEISVLKSRSQSVNVAPPVTKQSIVRKKNSVQNTSKSAASPKEPECSLNMEQATNDKCTLRCAISSGKECSTCDKQTGHKAVEWYQCQICAISGPAGKMKEHMFKHMTKVGIFVVSCENEDFDNLTMKPPFSNDACEPESNSLELNESHTAPPKSQMDNKTTKSINYPAKPICSLMSEVKCSRCREGIVDFDLMKNHPCLENSNQTYSCFVENCEYADPNRIEVLNHLENCHYDPIYIDTRTESSLGSATDMTCENLDYDCLHLRISESETMMVEPFIDIMARL